MKRKALFAVIGIIALLTYSCRKELSGLLETEIEKKLKDPTLALDSAQAKEYYKNFLKPQSLVKTARTSDSRENKKYVMFPKRYVSETKDVSFVEVPLYYYRKPVSFLTTSDDSKNLSDAMREAAFDRLVIFKNKHTGQIDQRIVRFIPDDLYLSLKKDLSKNHVNNLDPDYSGYMFYLKWDGTPLRVLRIVNGKVSQRIPLEKAKTKKNSATIKGCSIICYREWERQCWIPSPEDDDDQQVCTEWYLSYEFCWEECDDPDPNPDPNPDPDPDPEPGTCTDDCEDCNETESNYKNLVAGTVANETISIVPIESSGQSSVKGKNQHLTLDVNTRRKLYTWKIFRSALYNFQSTELGTHTLQNNSWKWESIEHQNIVMQGGVFGVVAECLLAGHEGNLLENNEIARMRLLFNIKYSAICEGFPLAWATDQSQAINSWHVTATQ